MLVIDWSLLVDILVKTASFIFSFPEEDIILATASESFDVTFVKAVFTILLAKSSWSSNKSSTVSDSMLLRLFNKLSVKFVSWLPSLALCSYITVSNIKDAVSASPEEAIFAIVVMVASSAFVSISVKILVLNWSAATSVKVSSKLSCPCCLANCLTLFLSAFAKIFAAFLAAFLAAFFSIFFCCLSSFFSSLVNLIIAPVIWLFSRAPSIAPSGIWLLISKKALGVTFWEIVFVLIWSKTSKLSSVKLSINATNASGLLSTMFSIINWVFPPLVFIIMSPAISAAVPSLFFIISVNISFFNVFIYWSWSA